MKNILKMTFKTSLNQYIDIKINNVDPDIENAISVVMDEMIASNALDDKKGVVSSKIAAILTEEDIREIVLP